MSLRFAFSSPSHAIATFFGSGLIRPASGTWGTLAGLLVFILVNPWVSFQLWVPLIVITFFVGAWACERTGIDIGVHDHSSIVIDEVFAIWLVLICVPDSLLWQILAFCLFRFFDIIKIFPANYFDTNNNWKNGWGVMLDDFVAAIQSILILCVLKLFVA